MNIQLRLGNGMKDHVKLFLEPFLWAFADIIFLELQTDLDIKEKHH